MSEVSEALGCGARGGSQMEACRSRGHELVSQARLRLVKKNRAKPNLLLILPAKEFAEALRIRIYIPGIDAVLKQPLPKLTYKQVWNPEHAHAWMIEDVGWLGVNSEKTSLSPNPIEHQRGRVPTFSFTLKWREANSINLMYVAGVFNTENSTVSRAVGLKRKEGRDQRAHRPIEQPRRNTQMLRIC